MTKDKVHFLLSLISLGLIVITIGAAFGELSGRGAMIGMVSTSIMVLITALIGGSRYGITTPTGPMTAAIAVVLAAGTTWAQNHGFSQNPALLLNATVFLAGIILLVLTYCGVGRLVKHVPHLVISGFMNGIAALIVLAQIKTMSGLYNWIVLLITFGISMFLFQFQKKDSHLVMRIFMSSLAVIIGMTVITHVLGLPIDKISVSGSINLSSIMIPSLDAKAFFGIFPLALELALIALLDTLLTSIILDKKTNTQTNYNQELTGQSIALSGVSLFGGLPGAQSTVPSMMMVQEDIHHPRSKLILAGLCILITAFFFPFLSYVPKAVFGGIILKVAFDVADFTAFKSIFQHKRKHLFAQLFVVLGVFFSTVFISINVAVIFFTLLFCMCNKLLPKTYQIPDLKPIAESEGVIDEI